MFPQVANKSALPASRVVVPRFRARLYRRPNDSVSRSIFKVCTTRVVTRRLVQGLNLHPEPVPFFGPWTPPPAPRLLDYPIE